MGQTSGKKEKENRRLTNELTHAGLQMQLDEKLLPKKLSSTLENLAFVVSGTFSKFTRDELKALIESHGGKIQSGVSSKTNYLLAGEESGPSKLEKAQKLNVAVIGEADFENMIRKK